MNKLDKLISKINSFCAQALCSFLLVKKAAPLDVPKGYYSQDDEEEDAPTGGGNPLQDADQFDIKDEELFNQFETFMDAYRELINSLGVDARNLTSESFEDAGQLIDTLNKRYERIMNNPYLNMSDKEGYDEDFSPAALTAFVQKTVSDAETRLKEVAGEDIDISEMRAAQYANEFNSIQENAMEGKKEEWSARKVDQALRARKEWFSKLMFIKKVGKSHPEYERYEKYIQSRQNAYQNIMEDPSRRAAYKEKTKGRIKDFRKRLAIKKKELEALLSTTKDPDKKIAIEKELKELSIKYRGGDAEEEAKQKARVKPKDTEKERSLDELSSVLKQNIANVKMGLKKSITENLLLNEGSLFKPYEQKISIAKASGDKSAEILAVKELQKAMNAHAESVPKIKEYIASSQAYKNYSDKLNIIVKNKWMKPEISVNDIGQEISNIIEEGKKILNENSKNPSFNSHNTTITKIIKLLTARINKTAAPQIDKSSPEYEKYIQSRRDAYNVIKADPDKMEAYKAKGRERIKRFRDNQISKIKDLESLLDKSTDPQKVEEITQQLNQLKLKLRGGVDPVEEARKVRIKKMPYFDRDISGVAIPFKDDLNYRLESLTVHLSQKIATQKGTIKSALTDKLEAEEHLQFKPLLDKLAKAKMENNIVKIKSTAKELQGAINNYAETVPLVVTYTNDAKQFYSFRDNVKKLNYVLNTNIPMNSEIKSHIQIVIDIGHNLVLHYQKLYPAVMEAVAKIISTIKEIHT